jgi:hypothetical protein
MRNHHLAARGGNEKTRFSISGSILSQDGIIESTGYDRQTFRANFDQKVTDRLSFGVNLNMSRTVQDNSRVDQPEGSWGKAITTTAMKFSPAIPVYDENGNYSAPYPPGESIDNPMALIKEQINTNTGFSMHMQATSSATLKMTDGLERICWTLRELEKQEYHIAIQIHGCQIIF